MTSDLWHRTGGVWPLGVSCSVTWYDLGAIAHIIQFAGIKAVLEVGVEHGGLAAWFISYGRYTDLAYRGVDITLNALQTKLGVAEWGSFVERDAWTAEAVMDASIWIDSQPGPCLIVVDGGNKPKELHLYAPLLREGDVMIGHDYRHEYGDDAIADVGAERVFAEWLDDTLLCMFVRRV